MMSGEFLKKTLKPYGPKRPQLRKFIEDYVNDLKYFYKSLSTVVRKGEDPSKYYKLFSILGVQQRSTPW